MSSTLYPVNFIFLSSSPTHSYDEVTGSMDSGYPRSIESDFPGIGDEIDAATYQYGTEPHISVILCCEIRFSSSLTYNFLPIGFFVRLLVFLPWEPAVRVQLHPQEGLSRPED